MAQIRRNLLLGAVGFISSPTIIRTASSMTITNPDRLVYLPDGDLHHTIEEILRVVKDKNVGYFIAMFDRQGQLLSLDRQNTPANDNKIMFS